MRRGAPARAGDVRLVGLTVAADAALLGRLARFAEGLGPLPLPPRARPARPPRAGRGGARALLVARPVAVALALERAALEYTAEVALPRDVRAPGGPARVLGTQRVACERLALALELVPGAAGAHGALRSAGGSAELAGLAVTYVERAACGETEVKGAAAPGSEGRGLGRAEADAAGALPRGGAVAEARLLALEHGRLAVSAARARGGPSGFETGHGPGLSAAAELSGVRARLEVEPAFAALQTAADVLAAARAVRKALAGEHGGANGGDDAPGQGPGASAAPDGGATGAALAAAAGGAQRQDAPAARAQRAAAWPRTGAGAAEGAAPGRARLSALAALDLVVEVRGAHAEAAIAPGIVWVAALYSARAAAASQSAALEGLTLTLNERPLVAVAAAVVAVERAGGCEPRACPWAERPQEPAHGAAPDESGGGGAAAPTPASPARDGGPARPFGPGCERLPAALRAAGAGSPGDAQTLDGIGAGRVEAEAGATARAPSAAPGAGTARAGAAGSGAALVLEVSLDGVLASAPHDQNFGAAQRATELWAKALQAALAPGLAALRASRGPAGAAPATERTADAALAGGAGAAAEAACGSGRPQDGGRKLGGGGGEALPPSMSPSASEGQNPPRLELRLAVRAAAFQMEHHPLEAWLAVHGPLLRARAGAAALAARALAAVAPPGPGAAPGSGESSTDGTPEKAAARASPGKPRSPLGSDGSVGGGNSGGATSGAAGGGAAAAAEGAPADGATEAVAADAAREYRRQCEQVRGGQRGQTGVPCWAAPGPAACAPPNALADRRAERSPAVAPAMNLSWRSAT